MGLFSRFFPRTIAEFHTRFNRDIKIVEKGNTRVLLVNGVEQSGGYVEVLFREALAHGELRLRSARVKRILVFGVGGGFVFRQLRHMYPDAHITGVDVDPEIIHIAKTYFELEGVGNCSLVIADARKFAAKHLSNTQLFDLVIIDIYVGNDVPRFVTQDLFLRNVKKLMHPGGRLIINYFSYDDQPQKAVLVYKRLHTTFIDVTMEQNLRNIFFYCRS